MAESVTQTGTNPAEEPDKMKFENIHLFAGETQTTASSTSTGTIIWTPTFIAIFGLTLVLGLSTESLLTQSWLDAFAPGWIILLAHILVLSIFWIALVVFTHSWWIRVGSIFGCIWAVFISANIVINMHRLDPGLPILAHLNVVICLALLGASICFSIDSTSLRRWDWGIFGLAIVGGTIAVVFAFFFTPAETRSLSSLETYVAVTALFLCILILWFRPSCWRSQPGPTLLFGLAPLLTLTIAIPNFAQRESDFFLSQLAIFPIHQYAGSNENRFFLFEVSLLCLLLGAMRILKGKLRA